MKVKRLRRSSPQLVATSCSYVLAGLPTSNLFIKENIRASYYASQSKETTITACRYCSLLDLGFAINNFRDFEKITVRCIVPSTFCATFPVRKSSVNNLTNQYTSADKHFIYLEFYRYSDILCTI